MVGINQVLLPPRRDDDGRTLDIASPNLTAVLQEPVVGVKLKLRSLAPHNTGSLLEFWLSIILRVLALEGGDKGAQLDIFFLTLP